MSNPVIDKLMNELMDCNDKREAAERERDELKTRMDALQDFCVKRIDERNDLAAKCAEMRDALIQFQCEMCNGTHLFTFECEACLSGFGDCTCKAQKPEPCPQCSSDNGLHNIYAKLEHALSSDCGGDYVPRSELDAEKAKVHEMRQRIINAHDRLLRGESDTEMLKLLKAGWSEPTGKDYVPRKELEEAREISKKYEDRYFTTKAKLDEAIAERDHYQKSNATQGRLFSEEYAKREALESKLAKCADFADTVDKDLKVAGEPNAEVHTRISHQFVGLLKAYREQREKTDALKTALKECVEALELYGERVGCDLVEQCDCGLCTALAKAKEALK